MQGYYLRESNLTTLLATETISVLQDIITMRNPSVVRPYFQSRYITSLIKRVLSPTCHIEESNICSWSCYLACCSNLQVFMWQNNGRLATPYFHSSHTPVSGLGSAIIVEPCNVTYTALIVCNVVSPR